jgi:carbamoyltransferase
MARYILSFKSAIGLYGQHDPASALFENGKLIFNIEEERLTRDKHAPHTFPRQSIQACLNCRNPELSGIDQIVLSYDPQLRSHLLSYYVRDMKNPARRGYSPLVAPRNHPANRLSIRQIGEL